jgi:hypothetical protein
MKSKFKENDIIVSKDGSTELIITLVTRFKYNFMVKKDDQYRFPFGKPCEGIDAIDAEYILKN